MFTWLSFSGGERPPPSEDLAILTIRERARARELEIES